MTCRICGRSSCTESFHSIEEQEQHEKKQEQKEINYDDGYDTYGGGPAPLD